jgi:DNA-directed RNA polymerase specialized sigma24 family protein
MMTPVGADGAARREFDSAYPRLVMAAHGACTRFFRNNPEMVQDAVAETMARTYEHWERVRRRESAGAWVVVCASRVCMERLRAQAKREETPPLSPPLASSSPTSVTPTSAHDMWQPFDTLTKEQRDVAALQLMDCDAETTAELLEMPLEKVRDLAGETSSVLYVRPSDLDDSE